MNTLRVFCVAIVALLWSTPAVAQQALGAQRTAVVLLNWQDVRTQPTSVARALSDMTAVRAWYQRASYGAMDLPFDVYGWVTANVDAAGQCMTGLADDYGAPLMVAQIGQAAWDAYAKHLWVLPTTAAPGVRCYPNAALCGRDAVVYDNVGPALHELGHTFCLPHVNARDKMSPGAGPWTFGPQAKTALGWLDRPGQPTTQLVTTGGTYAIEGYETAARGVKALRVRAKTGGLFGVPQYWVKSVNAGEVAIQRGGDDVDLGDGDVVLNVGQSWTSPEGITIRTESASTAGASIRVAYAGEAAPTPPAAQTVPAVTVAQFVGSSAEDSVRDVEMDAAGYVHIAGGTAGSLFGQANHGVHDAFYARFTAAGLLQCALVFGGPNYDRAYALSVAADGDAIVAGRAGAGFPTTAGVLQPTFGGDATVEPAYGPQDGFLVRIAPDCTIRWATYLGGPDRAVVRDVVAGPDGTIYAAMTTTWLDAPFVAGTRQAEDGVIARVSADGTTLLAARYVGGSGKDGGNPSVVADTSGVYLHLQTNSTDFPVTPGAAQTALGGGEDMALVKFDAALNVLWATYLGGNANETSETHHLALFPDGAIAVSQYTRSTNWPVTPGAVQATLLSPADWGLIVVSPDGSQVEAATYLGGTGDWPEGIAVDLYSRVIAAGSTGAAWGSLSGTNRDGVITMLPRDFTARTDIRIGGSGTDTIRAAAVTPTGVVVGGLTTSASFPGSGTYGGGTDGWWGLVTFPPPAVPPPPDPCVLDPLALTASVVGSHPLASWAVTATDTRGCTATETH